LTEFSTGNCPEESQVGYFAIEEFDFLQSPVYNMETHPDQAGLIAWTVAPLGVPVFVDIAGRTESDYGLDSTSVGINHVLAINSLEVSLWGVPADPSHDEKRYKTPLSFYGSETGASSNAPRTPYLQNPTTCGVPLSTSVDLEYYTGDTFHQEAPYPSTTGCDTLSFNPSLSAVPTTTQADSPSGVDVDLKVPQTQSPLTPSPSQIRGTTVMMPPGFAINPNAADGKTVCSDADSAIGTRHGATCPEFSKVGTASVDSSSLPGPIPGAIYLGDPKPGDRYRIILTADGFGTHVKLAGSAHPDSQTGQLTVSFKDLPQAPLSEFSMHFFGSERGLLATPTHCGTYSVETEFEPWDSNLPNQRSTSYFTIDSGPGGSPCPPDERPFNPGFEAGTASTIPGAHSPFSLRLTRNDGDQNLAGLIVRTPPGFAATLKGVPYCPESAIAQLAMFGYSGLLEQVSPACPPASQIGTASTSAGAGSHPIYVPGKVYLAGPYKGGPLSLVVVVPAVSGPYDLGAVAVRAAVHVDPTTAGVTTESDPLPQILDGIPLRTRSIFVSLDRPNFALNPTNCDPLSIDATALGDQGAAASLSSGFQVANCADMPYGPKLSLQLIGGLKRRGHPAIHSVLATEPGEANTHSVSVTLPPGELLDNAHITSICTRVQFSSGSCPAGSRIGRAEAHTPLFDDPLRGSVYLRSSSNKLPDLVVDLKGQVDFILVGRVDSVNGRLRTTFETVPDAPVSKFVLDLLGGKQGLLINSESLCGANKRATVKMIGQNGVAFNAKPKVGVACGANARHKRHSRGRVG
jgi:hypothetical protein